MSSSIGHVPTGDRWSFDAGVTEVFEDMLQRSIPQYEVWRDLVTDIAVHYADLGRSGFIVDLGTSRGESIARLLTRLSDSYSFIGSDVSQPMLEAFTQRFKDEIERGRVQAIACDLRSGYPLETRPARVVMAVLTIQFTPIEYRARILKRVYDSLAHGGAFIMVEKVLGNSAEMDDLLVGQYYRLKGANGYSPYEVERKRLSLEGVLVPVSTRTNEENLRAAGFSEVEMFWRWCNFAGWVAVKR
jgi:tRNA (cmo5U34)-methyltransferase